MRRFRRTEAAFKLRGPGPADINYCPIYGQSLAAGANATVISTEERTHAYMFDCGLRPQYRTSYYSVPYGPQRMFWYQALVAAKEQDDDDSGDHHETPCCGFADMVDQLITAENGPDAAAAYRLLTAAPGLGGQTLSALSWGSEPFEWITWQPDRAAIAASKMHKTFATQAHCLMQGEADYSMDTARATYRDTVITWLNRFGGTCKLGKQTFTPQLILGQVASHLAHSKATPTIALAQLDAARLQPDLIGVSAPQYIGDYSAVDNIHIDSATTRWLGAYFGLTYKRRVYDGLNNWNSAMQITSAVRNGDGIDVTTDAIGQLTIDTSWVTALPDGNYGIQVVDSGGSPVTVTGVSVTGANRFRVACANGGGAGSKIRPGWAGAAGKSGRTEGPRTNIRDSYGDSITFAVTGGDVRPMHRWLATDEVPTT